MQDLSSVCMVATFFQKSILSRGYHQISVAAADIPKKTAIIMPFGLFEYLFMPFGLSNAAQTFQRMMDCTTDGLEGVFAYMDDEKKIIPKYCFYDKVRQSPQKESFLGLIIFGTFFRNNSIRS